MQGSLIRRTVATDPIVPEIDGQIHRRGGQDPRNDEETEMSLAVRRIGLFGVLQPCSTSSRPRHQSADLGRHTRGPRHTPHRTANYLYPVAITRNTIEDGSLLGPYNLIVQTFIYDPIDDPPCGLTHTVEVGSDIHEPELSSYLSRGTL